LSFWINLTLKEILVNKLQTISIKYVKGIDNKTFILDLFPNKPSILVAPNGFGKSSIACAFDALKSTKLELNEKDFHKQNTTLLPELSVVLDGVLYSASTTSNAIHGKFDYSVINSPLYAKAIKRNMGRFTTATASLEAEDIELISTIPDNIAFEYSISSAKSYFGANGKILINLNSTLLDNLEFLYLFSKTINYGEFTKVRTYKKLLQPIKDRINNQGGTSSQIKKWIQREELTNLVNIEPLQQLVELITRVLTVDIVDSYLLATQLGELSTSQTFKKALEYKLYLREKQFFNDLLSSINTTRHTITVQEKRKSSNSPKKKLIISFPGAHNMSNGQRDILSFIAQIQKARREFRKSHCILVIDEVFDYLDDANLVAFQYYITKLIEEFKEQDRFLYPMLLTHLDPAYFHHFSFNKHKLQIRYLAKDLTRTSSVFLKLVKHREEITIKDTISKYHFHYYPEEGNIESELQSLGLRKAWGKSYRFYEIINNEVVKYLAGEEYDPIAVLLAVRIHIEKCAYDQLNGTQQDHFLCIHKTKSKLEYCEENGISIPETHYLLGLIYNDDLHWRQHRDYETPLFSKLENMTIKKMINEIFNCE